MKYALIAARTLLGLGFVIFGANILHPFMPTPEFPAGSPTAQFMAVMLPTGWMMVVGACQLIGGLLVLSGKLTPLGLVFLGPVLVNILAFHICIQGGEGLAPGLVFSVLALFVGYGYRGYFMPFLCANAKPPMP